MTTVTPDTTTPDTVPAPPAADPLHDFIHTMPSVGRLFLSIILAVLGGFAAAAFAFITATPVPVAILVMAVPTVIIARHS